MTEVHQLSRQDARRIAVQAQLLDVPRPSSLADVVCHLTFLQLDPAAPIVPSADLVLWSRLGSSYRPGELQEALEDLTLIDHHGLARPAADLALFRAEMAAWPGTGELKDWEERNRDWVAANDGCRRDLLELLRQDGPLRLRDLPDTCEVPWRSSGWNDHRSVKMLVAFMVELGEVARAGREGKEPRWDLASRIYPDDPVPSVADALAERDRRRLAALGIARAKAPAHPVEPNGVGPAGEPAVVAGVKGEWRVDPAYLGRPFTGRCALLSPLDRLVIDRRRTTELLEFDYQLEMFKPAAKRRWGYWALPILYGDRLVGKLDATAEREEGVLRVDAVHEDEPFPVDVRAAVDAEIESLAAWLGLEVFRP
ncbi:crosslink repair DNA glycosylase YcaQ family protein [Nocardioides sp. W7]|uniref:DNA glycosylase AlkZ-like family protein n=1 Tax=Nocardioides sp. W7 TaxID=2931390 RepID=UPI001FD22B0E|nr:crosslink repair DNA glycosylase YcaQ family protein [Nocardioides sp. W7]